MSDSIAQDALDAARLEQALKLRVLGAHWDEIARTCGYPSPKAALTDVGRAMGAATQRAEETADSMRDTANLRLEHLLRQTLGMLAEETPERYDEDGNPLASDDRAVKLRAVDEARRLVESITKLNKLDAPENDGDGPLRIEIVGIDPQSLV